MTRYTLSFLATPAQFMDLFCCADVPVPNWYGSSIHCQTDSQCSRDDKHVSFSGTVFNGWYYLILSCAPVIIGDRFPNLVPVKLISSISFGVMAEENSINEEIALQLRPHCHIILSINMKRRSLLLTQNMTSWNRQSRKTDRQTGRQTEPCNFK